CRARPRWPARAAARLAGRDGRGAPARSAARHPDSLPDMSQAFVQELVDHASQRFRAGGRFAYHYSRGKLGYDTIFHDILRRGLLSHTPRVLDLGSGQGSLFSWLLAAQQLAAQGHWPGDWAAPPQP